MDYVIPATTQIQPESTEISDRTDDRSDYKAATLGFCNPKPTETENRNYRTDIRLPRTLRVGRGSAVLSRVPRYRQVGIWQRGRLHRRKGVAEHRAERMTDQIIKQQQ